jgi:hypothetical protein
LRRQNSAISSFGMSIRALAMIYHYTRPVGQQQCVASRTSGGAKRRPVHFRLIRFWHASFAYRVKIALDGPSR